MLLVDKELDDTVNAVADILMPEKAARLIEHMGNLSIQIDNLRNSRDLWRSKYKALKDAK